MDPNDIDDVEDIEGVDLGLDDATETPTDTEETSTEEDKSTGTATKPVGTKDVAPTESRTEDNNEFRARYDSQGNVVDSTGKIIARAGAERRLYSELQTTRQTNEQLRSQLNEINERMSAGDPQKYGLSANEVSTAMQLFHGLKSDPAKTIQSILTHAKAVGVQLPDASIDLDAVRRMIDNAVAPLTERQRLEQENVASMQHADQEVREFFSNPDFADGVMHAPAMHALMTQDTTLDLRGAYYRLKVWALQNGLDFNQPLPAQVAARRANNGNARPMPNGSGTLPATAAEGINTSARPTTSTNDIVKQAMLDAGFDVSNL